MKAAVIREHGGPETVRIEQVSEPEAKPGEVVVEVRAAALNHLDLWVIEGRPGTKHTYPHVVGSDAAGVIAAMGPDVRDRSVGEEVVVNPGLSCGACEFCARGEQSECVDFGLLGLSRPGTFAERVAVPAGNVCPKPAHLSFEEAAALPLAHLTAWRMLTTRADLRPGETVLIHGIGGGVALAALQIASLLGARAIATSSSDEKLEQAARLGAAHAIDYSRTKDVAAEARRITGGRGVDVALDTAGAATWPIDIASVRRGGRVVICGVTTGPTAETDLRAVYWNQISLMGSTMGSREDFRSLLETVSATRLKPVMDRVFPLDQARDALERMAKGEQMGKIVLGVSGSIRGRLSQEEIA
ncbi:zinc-binding dehydrogenase [Candidatus Sumerlaeota bacterium]|nr:zinc-binding dehydrogenase [Candidatus Sumerlaeota bacterium]